MKIENEWFTLAVYRHQKLQKTDAATMNIDANSVDASLGVSLLTVVPAAVVAPGAVDDVEEEVLAPS
jgi:hypothetical protein